MIQEYESTENNSNDLIYVESGRKILIGKIFCLSFGMFCIILSFLIIIYSSSEDAGGACIIIFIIGILFFLPIKSIMF